jgi:hypothetical protein
MLQNGLSACCAAFCGVLAPSLKHACIGAGQGGGCMEGVCIQRAAVTGAVCSVAHHICCFAALQTQLLDGTEEEPVPVSNVEQLTEWVAYRVIGATNNLKQQQPCSTVKKQGTDYCHFLPAWLGACTHDFIH